MIPYRTRRILGKIFISIVLIAVVISLILLCWVLWLNRYIRYTRTGAELDFEMSLEYPAGELAVPPETTPPVTIYYEEDVPVTLPESTELTQLSGLVITGQMLETDFAGVMAQVKALSAPTSILLDVKNIRGEFFYSTSLGRNNDRIDPANMNALIARIRNSGHYLIARLPAYRDYWYGLENVEDGIFNPNRMSLWMDEERCYWLNPNAEGTLTYLISIVTELRTLGFDEVVFTDFRLPDTDAIYFEEDRAETIRKAAEDLVRICTTDRFALSFVGNEIFPLPEGRSRLYAENVAAAEAAALAQRLGLEDAQNRLVFLTDLKDTRYDAYGVLRPLVLNTQ